MALDRQYPQAASSSAKLPIARLSLRGHPVFSPVNHLEPSQGTQDLRQHPIFPSYSLQVFPSQSIGTSWYLVDEGKKKIPCWNKKSR